MGGRLRFSELRRKELGVDLELVQIDEMEQSRWGLQKS